MKCGRCQCRIWDRRLKNSGKESYITFANFEGATIETWICEKCSISFLQWFSKESEDK